MNARTLGGMEARDRALELVECGLVDAKAMLTACLCYMSKDDVQDMLWVNQFEEVYDEE